MDILTLIWNLLLGFGSQRLAYVRAPRRRASGQLPPHDVRVTTYVGPADARIAYGWMTAAPVHPLCARPPCPLSKAAMVRLDRFRPPIDHGAVEQPCVARAARWLAASFLAARR